MVGPPGPLQPSPYPSDYLPRKLQGLAEILKPEMCQMVYLNIYSLISDLETRNHYQTLRRNKAREPVLLGLAGATPGGGCVGATDIVG